MTIAQLLALAGVITKDPDHSSYTSDIKYSMFGASQEALATFLHPSYLRELKTKVARSSIASPGTFTLNSDFLRPCHFERDSDLIPVDFIDLEEKRMLRNALEGGNDERPRWTYYDSSGTKTGQIFVDTYPFTGSQWYIKRPPIPSASQELLVVGFDNLIILYFKHLFHLAEGQASLAEIALTSFIKYVDDYNQRRRS